MKFPNAVNVRIETADKQWYGHAIDLTDHQVDARTLLAAIRDDGLENDRTIEITCPPPGPVYGHLGRIRPGMQLRTRTALAAVARSRGLRAPQDEERVAIEERLSELVLPDAADELDEIHKQVAETSEDIDRLRERVARLQGKADAHRETESEMETLTSLQNALRELSEVETERAAAKQRLERMRKRQRLVHDVQVERFELEDRAANLKRDARRFLVTKLTPSFEATVDAVQERVPGGGGRFAGSAFDADPVSEALALARLAAIETPIILECDRFDSVEAAADWLDLPVIRL